MINHFLCGAMILAVFASQSLAGQIDSSGNYATGSGLKPGTTFTSYSLDYGSANNDNYDQQTDGFWLWGINPNWWKNQLSFGGPGVIDLVVTVKLSAGVSEYDIDSTVNLPSDYAQSWSGLRLSIGFGVGDSFELADPNSGLDFDYPNKDLEPLYDNFQNLSRWDANVLEFTTPVTRPSIPIIEYAIDIPDAVAAFPSQYVNITTGTYTFTLRHESMLVPEPASVALISFGCGVILLRRKRSK